MSTHVYTILEAESFKQLQNAQIRSGEFASGGRYVQHSGDDPMVISTTLVGKPGVYDLAVSYFDENDGRSRATLRVDGVERDSWIWDDLLGSSNAGSSTLTTHIIKNVTLDDQANIEISGKSESGEGFRVDRVELLRPSSVIDADNKPAFAGAEGFGADTVGGRGGAIVRVTNLNDSGEGSLRWALEDLEMPRIVVFDVSGRINLSGEIKINGDVTVAGQTAPGDGITVTGARLRVVESDVIIRGLKLRPGDHDNDSLEGRDAISVGTDLREVRDVIIDSNSMSWAIDETAVVWSGGNHITFSNNIFAESLRGAQPSFGMLLGDGAHHISVVQNLFANNAHRNPQLLGVKEVEIYNNLVSNWGDNGLQISAGDGRHSTAHVIGNYFLAGPDTSDADPIRLNGTSSQSAYQVVDNVAPGRASATDPIQSIVEGSGLQLVKSTPVFSGSGIQALKSGAVYNSVLENVGARAGGLDRTDARILQTVRDRDGDIISHPNDVGGLGSLRTGSALTDTDRDGIPDAYETLIGSRPTVFDPHSDGNRNGWSNIEDYINGLIDGFDFSAPGPIVTPTPPGSIRVEAESLTLRQGFVVDSNGDASSGTIIKANWRAPRSEAEFAFNGTAGTYGIQVNYFDEADGESVLSLLVNGIQKSTWTLDADLGSDWANSQTLTSRLINDIDLKAGDVISLVGTQDGAEPLRIDDFLLIA